jgi:DNA helicase II / ATP-dependent DNA helicase PcrA
VRFEKLNHAQREAVLACDGPVMILAGAGSGKTRTLISRIQWILENKNVSPYKILALTFSNKAAREMRERLAQVSDYDIGTFQVTTFHAFCSRVLRSESTYLGLSKHFTIFDDGESLAVCKAVLTRRGINLKDLSPHTLSYFVDCVKNIGWYSGSGKDHQAQELADDPRLWDLFLDYESELHRSNAVDFGGLITGVLQLFSLYPEVLEKYQRRFEYVLVDEYQDTNKAQFELVSLLAKTHKNICVVGDEDQSIYSWRGADIQNILSFERVFPNTKLIKLEQNYRSSKKIIQAASQLISFNRERKGKHLWTDNPEGKPIDIVECRDDRVEADYVAKSIKKLLDSGVSGDQIAVIYRNNSQSRSLEDSLRKEKISYHIVAGIKFYDRKEIKDLLCYMRVIVNPRDSLAFTRIINVPTRGIGASSLRKLEDEAIKSGVSLSEQVELIVEKPQNYKHLGLSSKVFSSLNALVSLIQETRVSDQSGALPSESYLRILHESGYLDFLKADRSYEGQARLENLQELESALKQFESENENAQITNFLETITLDTEKEVDWTQTVALMTAHGSKGLEYEYVFITGAEESLFPSFRSIEKGSAAIEEERRLFYVAMTRAMKELTITFCQGRMLWGSIKFNGPSQFLNEIPKELSNWTFQGSSKRDFSEDSFFDQRTNYQEDIFSQDRIYSTPKTTAIKPKHPPGSMVKHALYGSGLVLESEGFGESEKVLIKFGDGVKKRFMVKFAPLESV